MARYYDDYIAHAWGKDSESKQKEKSYNAKYYQKHKLEILAKRAKKAVKKVKSVLNDVSKTFDKKVKVVRKQFLEAVDKAKKQGKKNAKEIMDYAEKNAKSSAEEKAQQKKKQESSTTKKPKSRQKHKYLLKVTENGYTRYFYTQKEIDAYTRNKEKDAKTCKNLKQKDESESDRDRLSKTDPANLDDGAQIADNIDELLERQRKSGVSTYQNLSDEDFEIVKQQVYDACSVNPNYNTAWEYNNNCAYCTATYDLRQRGYDVQADPALDDYQGTPKEIESWYEGGKFVKEKAQSSSITATQAGQNVLKELEDTYEPGARGQFCVYWDSGGGHSMSFQVLPNGKAVIFDSQTYSFYDSSTIGYLYSSIDYTKSGTTMYMRTDNLPVTDEVLAVVEGQNVSETKKWGF